MELKMRKAEIQDGGERHLENQLYVITTVFMIRFCSNFHHRTVLTSSLRKCNRNRDNRKHNMAAAAILKFIYTS